MNIANSALKGLIISVKDDLLPILKAIAHEKRLEILIYLLESDQSFQTLLAISKLKKTALSHHLSLLSEMDLIDKPYYGVYHITQDGKQFLSHLYSAWHDSLRLQKTKMRSMQRREMSKAFISTYLQKE